MSFHKFFGNFLPAFYSNLSVGSTIKKRAQLAAATYCADADSARVSLVCSTESIGRARVNNGRSAQSNNDRQNVITGRCRKYLVSRDGLLTNQHLKTSLKQLNKNNYTLLKQQDNRENHYRYMYINTQLIDCIFTVLQAQKKKFSGATCTFHIPIKSATLNRLLHCSLWQFSGAFFLGLFFHFGGEIARSPRALFPLLYSV